MAEHSETGAGLVFPIWISLLLAKDKRANEPQNRKLVLGYMLGFTEAIEDDALRSRLTTVMFDAIFGAGSQEKYLAIGLAHAREPAFVRGAGFGYPDGERYFAVCDETFSCTSEQAEDVFVSLESMRAFLR